MKVDDFTRLSVLCPKRMAALHSDLSAEVGPDHNFLVVPAVSESVSLIANGGPVASCGPAARSSSRLVAPTRLSPCLYAQPGSIRPLPQVSALPPACRQRRHRRPLLANSLSFRFHYFHRHDQFSTRALFSVFPSQEPHVCIFPLCRPRACVYHTVTLCSPCKRPHGSRVDSYYP